MLGGAYTLQLTQTMTKGSLDGYLFLLKDMNTIIARKIDQTQKFLVDGTRIPVTMVHAAGNVVVAVKTPEKDTYTAVQLGFGTRKRTTQALVGHAKKANLSYVPATLREARLANDAVLPEIGSKVLVADIVKPGDIVAVTGTSKGKGFAGGVKRHNFRGGPKTHGQSDRHRAPGSIGSGTTPGRVYRGKRMAGHMGVDRVTVKNLEVVAVANDVVYIRGLVPGVRNGIITIEKTGENKKFVPLENAPISDVIEPVMEEVVETATEVPTEVAVAPEESSNTEVAEEVNEASTVAPAVAKAMAGKNAVVDKKEITEDAK